MSAAPRKPRRRTATKLAHAARAPAPPWETVLSSIGDALVILDADGRILLFNPAAEQLLDHAQAQVLGRSCADVFRTNPAVAEMVARTCATGQPQARTDELQHRRDRPVPVRLHASAIWDDDRGAILGTVLTIHDLSYQRTLEEEARRSERLAQLSTLVAGLAHEVKNPLGGIKGAAQLLALRLSDQPEVREYTDVIVRETNRLSALVDDLLMVGAPRPPVMAPLNIHKVIQDMLALVQPELAAARIAVRTEFDPSLPETCGDAAQLTQVLLNVIKNAIEAMRSVDTPSPRTLTILTRMETDFHLLRSRTGSGKFLRVEISDTGPGVPAGMSMRLFEPFFTTKPRGTGLGLAICQRIVAEHGGIIRVENRPRGGAVSTISLPLAS